MRIFAAGINETEGRNKAYLPVKSPARIVRFYSSIRYGRQAVATSVSAVVTAR